MLSFLGVCGLGMCGGTARVIPRRIPYVKEFWFFLLPQPGAVGDWPGAQPLPLHTPCWEPRVGGRRVYLAATTTAADWLAHRTPVHAFLDAGVPVRQRVNDVYGSLGLPFVFLLFFALYEPP